MADAVDTCGPFRSVCLSVVDGQWIVTIIEKDARSERDFTIEAFARSYADGQRHRLGLAQSG